MKLNSLQFKEYIIKEVKKIAQEEGWEDNVNILSENVLKSLKEDDFEVIDPLEWKKEFTEKISAEKESETLKKVNSLNEELKRMRELVDFRNPLFKEL